MAAACTARLLPSAMPTGIKAIVIPTARTHVRGSARSSNTNKTSAAIAKNNGMT